MASYIIQAIDGDTLVITLMVGSETYEQKVTADTSSRDALLAKLDAYALAIEAKTEAKPEEEVDTLPADVKALIGVERQVGVQAVEAEASELG